MDFLVAPGALLAAGMASGAFGGTGPTRCTVTRFMITGLTGRSSFVGTRAIAFKDFHLLPGNTPHRETDLEPGDLITHVTLPPPVKDSKQLYLKLRDRASYEFALASAAVIINIAGQNITRARIALGGVGTKPWRSSEAEAVLVDHPADKANFRRAAEAALRDAKPQSENGFKIELAKRCVTHALQMAVTS